MADTEFTTERWLPVVGYEGIYSVSDMGRVRSESREVASKHGSVRRVHEKVMACSPNSWGYRSVILCVDRAHRNFSVHRLVARAFIGERPTGADINHINGVKGDNRLANLEYVTRKENRDHAVRLGLLNINGDAHWLRLHPERVTRGVSVSTAKLTDASVRSIRALVAEGIRHKDIADRFGVTAPTVWKVAHRRAWAHVT